MDFSKTTQYALRVMTLLAEKPDELVSSNTLYKSLKIPKKYLQRLLTKLSKNGLVDSIKGKYGGFKLSRSSKKIFLSEIVEAVEGFNTEPTCFFGFGECINTTPCAMHDAWAKSQKDLIKVLSSTRLSDLTKI
jgi:Rrf2 family protein